MIESQKKDLIGRNILEIRCQSFFLRSKQICEIIAFYFHLDNEIWLKLTVEDGRSIMKLQNEEPIINDIDKLKEEFEYPIRHFELDSLTGLNSIEKIEEYLWQGKQDESCGLLISLKDGSQLSIIEKDDCLNFEKSKSNRLLKNCILVNYDLNRSLDAE